VVGLRFSRFALLRLHVHGFDSRLLRCLPFSGSAHVAGLHCARAFTTRAGYVAHYFTLIDSLSLLLIDSTVYVTRLVTDSLRLLVTLTFHTAFIGYVLQKRLGCKVFVAFPLPRSPAFAFPVTLFDYVTLRLFFAVRWITDSLLTVVRVVRCACCC